MGRALTPDQRGQIQQLLDGGWSKAATATKVGVHYNTVLKFDKTGVKHNLDDPAKRALTDFGLFRRRYMGRVTTPWQETAAQKIVELLDSEKDEYLVINVAPGLGKSTMLTDVCLWVLVRDRGTRIMYGSAAQAPASDYTYRVMTDLTRQDLTRAKTRDVKFGLAVDGEGLLEKDYGTFKPANGARWTKEKFYIAQSDGRSVQEKEPSMVAFGRDSTFLGGRFDLVVWDDLVSEKTLKTAEARDSLINWWNNTAETRVEPGGLNCLVGQRLSAEDLYRYAIDLPSGEEWDDLPTLEDHVGADPNEQYSRKYHHIVFPAHNTDVCLGPDSPDHARDAKAWPDGCLLDPKRLSWPKIKMLQANPLNHFETVYQQEDTDPSTSLVQKEWIEGGTKDNIQFVGCKDVDRGIAEVPHGLGNAWSVVSVDPSPSKYWSIQWYLCHPDSKTMHLMDHVRQAMTAPSWLDYNIAQNTFTGFAEEWWQRSVQIGRPITHMIVEVNAAQRFMLQSDYIKRWQSLRGVLIVPHSTTNNKTDATYGVQSLAPVWMHGRIRLPYRGGEAQRASMKLTHEVLRWPNGATDDCVMAQWFVHYQWPKISPAKSNVYRLRPDDYLSRKAQRGIA
jgi:hypothetical protein